jgi:hypothetical protein
MGSALRSVVAAALVAALPGIARAGDDPGAVSPPPEQDQPPGSVAPAVPPASPPLGSEAPPAAPPPAAKQRPVHLVVTLGYDYGFEDLVTAVFSDGSTKTIEANGGFVLAVGATFLPLRGGEFETQATLGYKYDAIRATNATITYHAFPLEILEAWRRPPLRLAAGVSLALGSRVQGSGDASEVDVGLRNSLGLVGQAELTFPFARGRARWAVGGRFIWQRLQLQEGGPATDANAAGLFLGLVL